MLSDNYIQRELIQQTEKLGGNHVSLKHMLIMAAAVGSLAHGTSVVLEVLHIAPLVIAVPIGVCVHVAFAPWEWRKLKWESRNALLNNEIAKYITVQGKTGLKHDIEQVIVKKCKQSCHTSESLRMTFKALMSLQASLVDNIKRIEEGSKTGRPPEQIVLVVDTRDNRYKKDKKHSISRRFKEMIGIGDYIKDYVITYEKGKNTNEILKDLHEFKDTLEELLKLKPLP
jgi:hypothetical protein